MRSTFILSDGEQDEEITLERRGRLVTVRRGDAVVLLEAVRLPDGRLSLLLEDGRQVCGRVVVLEEGLVEVSRGAGRKQFGLADPLRHRLRKARADSFEASGEEEIRSAMPGRVVEVRVAPGDRVEPNALLLVLEAMKMQNEIRTARGGVIGHVPVRAGESVESGVLLARVEADSKK